jgi:tetratricopeptide (TPR) repeat protein
MNHCLKASVFLLLFLPIFSFAQRTAIYRDQDMLYKQGLDLFDKRQYASAQKFFNDFASQTRSSVLKGDATYYAAACGIELFNKDSEWLMREFIMNYPASTKINSAHNYLGKSNFRKKKYKETLEYLEKVDIYRLDKDELAEYYFKRGYSYLQKGEDAKAKADFSEIKDVENRYAFPANYYFSHLEYKDKNYEIALHGFQRLVGNETFGSVVPFYITQIYFIQGKFEKVVQEAPKLLKDSSHVQKETEINRMIGESYFNLKDYPKALPYLKKSSLDAQGNYVLGYCCYKMNDFANAAAYFEKATVTKDSIAQSAWYHLADCYIKQSEKAKAKNAYYGAYQLDFDKRITEDALFSFAKLSYELDFNPYNESVKSFSKYLKEYPNSPKKDECYNYLVTVYSTTKNYEQAIKSIESLGTIDPILKVTYQKLLYFRGVEFFNINDLNDAEKYFRMGLQQNADPKWNSLCQYWLSEISYLRKDFTTAIEGWKKFQVIQGATALPEYDLSSYDLGYAYFQRKEGDDYTNAQISFRKFLLNKSAFDERKVADANIRTADSYFMNRDFVQASEYYRTAITQNKFDVDYSLYQKALCDGLNKNYNEKISELKKIETRYPNSNYMAAAINEIADTYYNNIKDEENAIAYYEKVLNKFPNSSFVNNCYAQLGNIYYGRKQDDKAFTYYDKFVKNNPKSDASKEVLESIKKIFEAKGDVEGMTRYFESVGNPLSENQIEKVTYTAAYDAFYNLKNCDEAMPKWEAYINKFPNGKYITEAYFDFAECAYSKNMFEKALPAYQYVISKPRGLYTEVSLAKTSFLLFKEKKYQEALPLFQQLQEVSETPSNKSAGRLGAMRCAFYLDNYQVALEESNKVLATEKNSPQQTAEARYIKARCLYETGSIDDAMIEFRAITKNAKNLTGAEAYYYIAKIQFTKQDYKEVEKTVNKLIGYEYSNDDWNNKGMLLLADAYLAKGELADARVILQTIIENKPKGEFEEAARKKLAELDALEGKSEMPSRTEQKQDLQVEFDQTGNDDHLFDEKEKQQPAPSGTVQPK